LWMLLSHRGVNIMATRHIRCQLPLLPEVFPLCGCRIRKYIHLTVYIKSRFNTSGVNIRYIRKYIHLVDVASGRTSTLTPDLCVHRYLARHPPVAAWSAADAGRASILWYQRPLGHATEGDRVQEEEDVRGYFETLVKHF
jgi:hypothetical protein